MILAIIYRAECFPMAWVVVLTTEIHKLKQASHVIGGQMISPWGGLSVVC